MTRITKCYSEERPPGNVVFYVYSCWESFLDLESKVTKSESVIQCVTETWTLQRYPFKNWTWAFRKDKYT